MIYKISGKQYYVYILGNIARTVLYSGFTDDLVERVWQHKNEIVKGFTQKYKVHDLLYYEIFSDPENAILREKQIKSWNRKRKESLILKFNPTLKDLYSDIVQ